METEEEYEIIPTSPLRTLEKRMSRLESSSASSEIRRLIEQIIELIKSNQRIIDDVIKSDAELRNEISKIPGKIDQLLTTMAEFMELLKTSAAEETITEVSKDMLSPVSKDLREIAEYTKKNAEINQATLTAMSVMDKRFKRISMQLEGLYRR